MYGQVKLASIIKKVYVLHTFVDVWLYGIFINKDFQDVLYVRVLYMRIFWKKTPTG